MTTKQLTEMGFSADKLRVYHGATDTSCRIKSIKLINPEQLISLFYGLWFNNGVEYGKASKAEEIKKILGIEPHRGCSCGPNN